MDIRWIRNKVRRQEWHLSGHAEEERLDEAILVEEIEDVLLRGMILEDYPNDPRGPSALLMGYGRGGNPVQVGAGKTSSNQLRVITVYVPKPPKWTDPQTRGKQL